jgi:hypothetical protein
MSADFSLATVAAKKVGYFDGYYPVQADLSTYKLSAAFCDKKQLVLS